MANTASEMIRRSALLFIANNESVEKLAPILLAYSEAIKG